MPAVRLRAFALLTLLLLSSCTYQGAPLDPVEPFEHPEEMTAQLPAEVDGLKFIVFGDHGRRGDYYQEEVAERMGAVAEEVGVDFIVTTGDNFYPSGVNSVSDSHWEESFEDVYTAPSLHVPWYPVLGNHDWRGDVEAQIAYTDESDRWHFPDRYYTLETEVSDSASLRLVFADTDPIYEMDPDRQGEPGRQLAWIDSTLAHSQAQWNVVVGHRPVFSAGRHGNSPIMLERLDPLLRKHPVDLYLAGHDHNLQHLPTYALDYVVSGAGSRLRPVGEHPLADFAAARPGFTLVTVTEEYLMLQFIDHEGNILYGTVLDPEGAAHTAARALSTAP